MNYLLTTLCLEFPRREGFAGAGAGGFETSFVLNHPIESPYNTKNNERIHYISYLSRKMVITKEEINVK